MMPKHVSTDDCSIGVPSQLCSVCCDASTGIHFGGNSCESCKAFFRRSVQCNRFQNYKCSNEERCPVNIVTRKVCQYCRYARCTKIGMKSKWVLSDQEREEKYGTRRKRFRENRTPEEDPDIYKHLTKEEKLLIEDIAHALYQSRATYPLLFPSQLNQYLRSLSSSSSPTPPVSSEKLSNPSANFLIVPIQRLVLFARMLKDFELFSEDDKVNLLKGSAIEIMVCSSNTLFNPKTHTFTNYLSRDQRAVMDDQVMPLDPLLKRLWGEDLFNRTKTFLISMCNLHIDEVASTLLVPVILFSPDRSNIKDLNLVKYLQSKYATLVLKYMNWRYGIQQTDQIYPKLLLQIIQIRTLSVSHAEVIQKVMSTSSVNPLVQEVVVGNDIPRNTKPTVTRTDKMDSLSIGSIETDLTNYDKTPTIDMESNIGSDDDEILRKKPRSPLGDEEELDETNSTNIWTKRRKLSSVVQNEITNMKEITLTEHCESKHQPNLLSSNCRESEKYFDPKHSHRRPHDHQVPNFVCNNPDKSVTSISNRTASSLRHLTPKKQSSISHRDSLTEQIDRPATNEPSLNYSQLSSANSAQYYADPRHTNYSQSPPNYSSQKPAEQDCVFLSLVNNPNPVPPTDHSSHSGAPLAADEQQLLNAIHAHPNKRDLVLNLLRQLNESSSTSNREYLTNIYSDKP